MTNTALSAASPSDPTELLMRHMAPKHSGHHGNSQELVGEGSRACCLQLVTLAAKSFKPKDTPSKR